MLFTDYLFLPLLLLTALLYYVIPLRFRWILLLIASLLFYATWGIELLPFAIAAALAAYLAGLAMDRRIRRGDLYLKRHEGMERKRVAAFRRKIRGANRLVLFAGCALLLFLLVYVKAQPLLLEVPLFAPLTGFFSGLCQAFASFFSSIPGLRLFVACEEEAGGVSGAARVFMPLGISYYTLSLVGYLADVYWRKDRAERSFPKLLLFALYFPKILEGPISRHSFSGRALREGRPFDFKGFCFGLQRILWGYFKLLVMANRLNRVTGTVFGSIESMHGSQLLFGAVCGALELYCDFSGCMDIALGASELFGIALEENFARPFFSRSAAEFWRRWHITLGGWFKDYVFLPIATAPRMISISTRLRKSAGNRAGKAFVTVIPLAVVWLLTGLWHGTGANYIVWGLYWGGLMILSGVLEPELKKLTRFLGFDPSGKWYRRFQMARTFLLFVISRIITIPGDLGKSGLIFRNIFRHFGPWHLVDGSLFQLGLDRPDFYLTLLCLFLLYKVGQKQEAGMVIRERLAQLPIVPRWAIYIGGILAVLILGVYGPGYDAAGFVYMNY